MSYPPNSPSIICRNPQHGIYIAGLIPDAKPTVPSSSHKSSASSSHSRTSSSSTISWDISSTTPHNTHTTTCAESGCNNKVNIIPFSVLGGFDALDGAMNIKARCNKCEPAVIMAQLPEGHIPGWKGEEVMSFAAQKWEEAGEGEEVVEGQW
jgi:hypothetical protein